MARIAIRNGSPAQENLDVQNLLRCQQAAYRGGSRALLQSGAVTAAGSCRDAIVNAGFDRDMERDVG